MGWEEWPNPGADPTLRGNGCWWWRTGAVGLWICAHSRVVRAAALGLTVTLVAVVFGRFALRSR